MRDILLGIVFVAIIISGVISSYKKQHQKKNSNRLLQEMFKQQLQEHDRVNRENMLLQQNELDRNSQQNLDSLMNNVNEINNINNINNMNNMF